MATLQKHFPKILLVEDLPIAQKIARYALHACQCKVDVASNGTDAIAAVQNDHYDLVFMDLGLPDIDGLTVTETIRRTTQPPVCNVPIIALTAHLDDKIKQDAFNAGMTGYVLKPLNEAMVQNLLQLHVITPIDSRQRA